MYPFCYKKFPDQSQIKGKSAHLPSRAIVVNEDPYVSFKSTHILFTDKLVDYFTVGTWKLLKENTCDVSCVKMRRFFFISSFISPSDSYNKFIE